MLASWRLPEGWPPTTKCCKLNEFSWIEPRAQGKGVKCIAQQWFQTTHAGL